MYIFICTMKYARVKTGSSEFAFVDELQLLFADALSGTLFCISIPVTEDTVAYRLRLYISMYACAFRVTLK